MSLNQRHQKRDSSTKVLFTVIILAVILIAGTVVYYLPSLRGGLFSTAIKQPAQNDTGFNSFSSDNGLYKASIYLPIYEEIKTQEIKIAMNPVQTAMIDSLVSEFCRLLPDNLKGIKLNSSYKDKDGVVYLDFNSELKTKASFSAAQEYAFLGALYQSVTKNIPDIIDIRVLIDGKEVDTLSGHFYITKGFKEAGIE